MNFFCTKEHYDSWVKSMELPENEIFCLETKEAIWVSKMLFSLED